jgi:hypothetical protein
MISSLARKCNVLNRPLPPQSQFNRSLTPAGRALLERLNSVPDQVDWEGYKRWGDTGRLFAREVGLKAGESGIVVNGRVSDPLNG